MGRVLVGAGSATRWGGGRLAITRRSFEEFYARTVDRLLGQLFLVTADLHEAEEVVQEAFVRAASRWGRLEAYDVPEAWVRRVAMNLAADRARWRRRRQVLLRRLGEPPQVPAAGLYPAMRAARLSPTDALRTG